jgi:hypothetical protein
MERLLSLAGLVMMVGLVLWFLAPEPPQLAAGRSSVFWPRTRQLAIVMFACGLLALLLKSGAGPVLR